MPPLRLVLAAPIVAALLSCDALAPKNALTPARELEGTWTTALPVTFSYQTDFCAGGKQTVAQALWNVTWEVTAVEGFENVLDIEMRFSRGSSTPVSSGCGNSANGWVPLVSPTFLEATVSSSAITAYDQGSGISAAGSYTTDLMSVTWIHYECLIYCFGEYTASQALKLVRQR